MLSHLQILQYKPPWWYFTTRKKCQTAPAPFPPHFSPYSYPWAFPWFSSSPSFPPRTLPCSYSRSCHALWGKLLTHSTKGSLSCCVGTVAQYRAPAQAKWTGASPSQSRLGVHILELTWPKTTPENVLPLHKCCALPCAMAMGQCGFPLEYWAVVYIVYTSLMEQRQPCRHLWKLGKHQPKVYNIQHIETCKVNSRL